MGTEHTAATPGSALWALLVGINDYQAIRGLRGCINDVDAVRLFLINQLHVPDDHILVLKNEKATRSAILDEFQHFLIGNPRIKRNDQILFHYSGHGSQMPDPTGSEPDGYNETIVPYDSRNGDVYDIPDKTIAALLDQLAAEKGDNITVILDSCHSGSATRRLEAACVRLVPADDRLPPLDLDAAIRSRAPTRAAGPSGWASHAIPYVLLAGCRDREVSNEYLAVTGGAQVWHGALTYFTLEALRNMDATTTYADIHEQVASKVNLRYPGQTPQCEGKRNRAVFGGATVDRDPFISVQKVQADTVTLNAGLVHGLASGTEVALYPPQIRTRSELPPTPLATAEVIAVSATGAVARLTGAATQTIPLHARAVISKHTYAGLQQTVALHAAEGAANAQAIAQLHQAIEHATPDGQPSPYLQLVETGRPAALRVEATQGRLLIYGEDDQLLVQPEDIQDTGQGHILSVMRALESIARFRTIVEMSNKASSQLAGKVKLGVRRLVQTAEGPRAEALSPEASAGSEGWTVYFDPDHQEHNLYVVDVTNDSDLPLYPHVFTLSPDYSIHLLYPSQGQQEAIAARTTFTIGLRPSHTPLEFFLPDGWDSSRDRIKAILTTQPFDATVLAQDGLNVPAPTRAAVRALNSPLDQLLDAISFGAGKRFAAPHKPQANEEWTTVDLLVTTVRLTSTRALSAPAGRVALGDGLTLVKPLGFQGKVSVTTWGQATRGADGTPTLKPPPGLSRFSELFEPIGRTGTRNVGATGLVITLEVDDASRQSITPANPLRLELPVAAGEQVTDLLPVAFDGEDYLLAGYASDDRRAVDVVSLPTPVITGEPGVRDIGRAIKLFIYKKIGRYSPLIGLHRAEIENGQVVYKDIRRDQFKRGQKVALFLHGFTSDTRWMIQGPGQFLRQTVLPYDHLLAWDYETIGTGIEENGEKLAQALRQQCGFGPRDGITLHIFSHSMGCLVARCMIELAGGHDFVDRLVMAGPPNRGTTLATLGKGLVYLTTALINHFSPIPPIGAVATAVKEIYEQGAGVKDIVVDSPVIKKLNERDKPDNVPYLVLAGENRLSSEAKSRLKRLAMKVFDRSVDTIIGEPNDGFLEVSSMLAVRGGAYPRLEPERVPCDHFHYYVDPQAQLKLKSWLVT